MRSVSHWQYTPWWRTRTGTILSVLAVLYGVSFLLTLEVSWPRVWSGLGHLGGFLGGFLKPDFVSRGADIVEGMMESLAMTLVSTVLGFLAAVPLGIFAAKNLVAPSWLSRTLLSLLRAFPELIIAVFMVRLFGNGTFAGTVTLWLGTVGFLGKLLADAIEECPPERLEALRATGAGFWQVVCYAVLPSVWPRLAGLTLYRLDINFRDAAVLGIVGAGGIGDTLDTAIRRYEYHTAAAILYLIIALVFLAEYLSSHIRRRLL